MSEKPKSIGKTVLSWFVVQEDGAAAAGNDAAAPAAAAKRGAAADPAIDDLIARYAGGDAKKATRPPAGAAAAPAPPAAPARTGSTAGPGAATLVGAPAVGAGAAAAAAPAGNPGAAVPPPVPGAAAGLEDPDVAPAQVDFPAVYKKRGLSAEDQGHVEKALTLLGNLPKETPAEVKRQIVGAALLAFGVPVDRIIEAALLHQRALEQHVKDGERETGALFDEANRRLAELEAEMGRVRKIMTTQVAGQKSLALACQAQGHKVQEVLTFFGTEAVERVAQASTKLRGG